MNKGDALSWAPFSAASCVPGARELGLLTQSAKKLLCADSRLFEHPDESANLDLAVVWNHATRWITA